MAGVLPPPPDREGARRARDRTRRDLRNVACTAATTNFSGAGRSLVTARSIADAAVAAQRRRQHPPPAAAAEAAAAAAVAARQRPAPLSSSSSASAAASAAAAAAAVAAAAAAAGGAGVAPPPHPRRVMRCRAGRPPSAPRPLPCAPAAATRSAAAAAPARTAMHAQAPPRLPHATPYYPHDPPVHPASEPPCSIAGILPHSTPAGRLLISGRSTPPGGSEQQARERWRRGRLHEQERATHDQASACRVLTRR